MSLKVSIILPVYNVDKYLDKCLNSIVNQIYNNLEIILVDDGSSDNSALLCDKWLTKDKRIKVIHQDNKGPSCARNTGLDNVSGDLISFIDPDDYIDVNLYNDLVKYFNEDNKLDLLSFGFYEVTSEPNKIDILDGYLTKNEALTHLLTWNGKVRSFVWNKIYRYSLIKNIRFDEELHYGEDLPFVYYSIYNCNKYLQINKPYYYYVRRNNSFTTSSYKHLNLDTINASKRLLDNNNDYQELLTFSVLYNCNYIKKELLNKRKEYKDDYKYVCKIMNSLSLNSVYKYYGLSMYLKYLIIKIL